MSLSMQGSGRECWENSPRMDIDLHGHYSQEQPAPSTFFFYLGLPSLSFYTFKPSNLQLLPLHPLEPQLH